MAVSAPMVTLSVTKNHSSIPHQNKLHADEKKKLKKREQQESICPQYVLKALHFPLAKSCSHCLDKEICREWKTEVYCSGKCVQLGSDHRLTRVFIPPTFCTNRTWRHGRDHPVSGEDPFEVLSWSPHPPQFQLTLSLATQPNQTRNHSASK